MKIPDRWLKYKASGRINGTRFVAFKAPLKEGFSTVLPPEESLTPKCILQKHPKIKLVINLSFSTKYYDGYLEFEKNGVQYIQIKSEGHSLPTDANFKKFEKVVDDFLETHPDDSLIGVHCLHGVNRTGYFIVRYMIERLGYPPNKALRVFYKSRGHAIERTKYIADLLQIKNQNKLSVPSEKSNQKFSTVT